MNNPCEKCVVLPMCKIKIKDVDMFFELDCEILSDYIAKISIAEVTKLRKFFGTNTPSEKHRWYNWHRRLHEKKGKTNR